MSVMTGEGALTIFARAKELERAGRSIIHLELGEPDFHPAKPVNDALKRAIDEGKDRYCPVIGLPALREALTNVAPGATSADIKKLIGGFSTGETAGPVAAQQAKIDALFAHDRMEDIVAALKRVGSGFAQATLKTLAEKSPRGMVVALKLLRLARTSGSLEECLVREYRAALEVFASDDFREGVRAAVIDKDRSPKWSPPRIEHVTPAMQAPYFAEIGADELRFN
jgi:enoyl-CoA hydratase